MTDFRPISFPFYFGSESGGPHQRQQLYLAPPAGESGWDSKLVRFVKTSKAGIKETPATLDIADAILFFVKLVASEAAISYAPHLFLPIAPIRGRRPNLIPTRHLVTLWTKTRPFPNPIELGMGDATSTMRQQVEKYARAHKMDTSIVPGEERAVLIHGGAIKVAREGTELSIAFDQESKQLYFDRSLLPIEMLLEIAPHVLGDWLTYQVDHRYFFPFLPITLENLWKKGLSLPQLPRRELETWENLREEIRKLPGSGQIRLDGAEQTKRVPPATRTEQMVSIVAPSVGTFFSEEIPVPVKRDTHKVESHETLDHSRAMRLGLLVRLIATLKDAPEESDPVLRTQTRILAGMLPELVELLCKVTSPAELSPAPRALKDLPEELRHELLKQAIEASRVDLRAGAQQILQEEFETERAKFEASIAEERRKLGEARKQVDEDRAFADSRFEEAETRHTALEERSTQLEAEALRLKAGFAELDRARTLLEADCFGQAQRILAEMQGFKATKAELRELEEYKLFAARSGRKDTDVPDNRPELFVSKNSGKHGKHGKK